jgi:formate hydrogenlyase subunit 6/NADH:ubiquinone oxidoreductase subunit I
MDAIQLKFFPEATNKFKKAVEVDVEKCIGCGVCVHKCKTKSIILESREETTRPPKNGRELVQINAMAALAAKEEQAKN